MHNFSFLTRVSDEDASFSLRQFKRTELGVKLNRKLEWGSTRCSGLDNFKFTCLFLEIFEIFEKLCSFRFFMCCGSFGKQTIDRD